MKALRPLAVGWLVACTVSCAHRPNAVVTQWVLQNCRVGEQDTLETKLRTEGKAAERGLIRYYGDGPGSSTHAEIEAEAGRQFDEIIGALNAGRTYGLSGSEVDSIRADSRSEYIQAAVDDFDNGFRTATLKGLAVVGRPKGVKLLRRVATDPSSSDRQVAIAALAAAGIPVTPP